MDGIGRDVIVVGAGLAGLGAAHALRDCDTLLLEKAGTHGGRVRTRHQEGIRYDLGAVFAFDPELLPPHTETPRHIPQSGSVGAHWQGHAWFGQDVADCLSHIPFQDNELERLISFVGDGGHNLATLPPAPRRLVNAFFQLIHPGEMEDYLPARRLDAFITFASGRYATGNGALVDSYANKIEASLQYRVDVTEIRDTGNEVIVTAFHHGQRIQLRTRAVICATPANAAAQLLVDTNGASRHFLEQVRYGKGSVTVLAIPNHLLRSFQYIATPELSTTTIVRQHCATQDIALLYFYYMGAKSAEVSRIPLTQRVDTALDALNALGIGTVDRSAVRFADYQHWRSLSPIISGDSYGNWHEDMLRPSPRVILAGDYTYVDSRHLMPYGMAAALRSGQRAASSALRILAGDGRAQR